MKDEKRLCEFEEASSSSTSYERRLPSSSGRLELSNKFEVKSKILESPFQVSLADFRTSARREDQRKVEEAEERPGGGSRGLGSSLTMSSPCGSKEGTFS